MIADGTTARARKRGNATSDSMLAASCVASRGIIIGTADWTSASISTLHGMDPSADGLVTTNSHSEDMYRTAHAAASGSVTANHEARGRRPPITDPCAT